MPQNCAGASLRRATIGLPDRENGGVIAATPASMRQPAFGAIGKEIVKVVPMPSNE